jgi:hypothetical protein
MAVGKVLETRAEDECVLEGSGWGIRPHLNRWFELDRGRAAADGSERLFFLKRMVQRDLAATESGRSFPVKQLAPTERPGPNQDIQETSSHLKQWRNWTWITKNIKFLDEFF